MLMADPLQVASNVAIAAGVFTLLFVVATLGTVTWLYLKERRPSTTVWAIQRSASGKPLPRPVVNVLTFYWAMRGFGPYREVMLRWLPSRWRVMVEETPDSDVEWASIVDGHVIPLFTRGAAQRRKEGFLLTHPGDMAWVERRPREGGLRNASWMIWHTDFDKAHRCPVRGTDRCKNGYVSCEKTDWRFKRWHVYTCGACGLRVARMPFLLHHPESGERITTRLRWALWHKPHLWWGNDRVIYMDRLRRWWLRLGLRGQGAMILGLAMLGYTIWMVS